MERHDGRYGVCYVLSFSNLALHPGCFEVLQQRIGCLGCKLSVSGKLGLHLPVACQAPNLKRLLARRLLRGHLRFDMSAGMDRFIVKADPLSFGASLGGKSVCKAAQFRGHNT